MSRITWSSFTRTLYGAEVKRFFVKLNTAMEAETVCNSADAQPVVLVLNTKKGYWLYKTFMREEKKKVCHVFICSDRYIKKMVNYSLLMDKIIYLVDDTLTNGFSLMETYNMLIHMGVAPERIHPIVFALNEKVRLEENEQDPDEQKAVFWKKIKYFVRMTEEEMGEFCLTETKLLHNEHIPYLIDVPYLKDEHKKHLESDYEVVLTGDQFGKLKECDGLWEYHDNSYTAPVDDGEKLLEGFIIEMNYEQLLLATQKFISDYVITGTYFLDEDGNVHILFIPFALTKSIDKATMNRLWKYLVYELSGMDGCLYPNEDSSNLWESKYKECAYVLSMIVAEKFKTHLASLVNVILCYDDMCLREHFSLEFIQRIEAIQMSVAGDLTDVCRRCSEIIGDIQENDHPVEVLSEKKPYIQEDAYDLVTSEVQARRIKFLMNSSKEKDVMLESEELSRKLEGHFEFRTETERRYAFARVFITLLQTSMCSSRLRLSPNGERVEKGVRYGENSDLAFPYFDLNFYWAVILLVEKMGKNKALEFYDYFVILLKKLFLSLKLYNENTFYKNKNYFKVVLENDFQLYNKYFCFNKKINSVEKSYLDRIEEFIQNIS